MTQKQIAERLGVEVKQLDYEFHFTCADCARIGGIGKPCAVCIPVVKINIKEAAKG